MIKTLKKISSILLGTLIGCTLSLAGLLFIAIILTYPKLPSLEMITEYHPKIPLRVYSSDGVLIGEFGSERRSFVKIGDAPDLLKQAILAAEDDHFYQHGGVDYMGVARAVFSNITGGVKSGASTITMQVARNFFLSSEKTFSRKFNEVLLAYKIEKALSKDQILELYFNQIYLGQRAYGFASAAKTYFGKSLNELNIAEMAMLAGLPKAPSAYNPVVNPHRAQIRQTYVINRMLQLGYITQQQANDAKNTHLHILHQQNDIALPAQYIAEMVRLEMLKRYGEDAYQSGYKVYTTINSQDQRWAFDALRKGLLDFDKSHGYRGPEGFIDLKSFGSNWEELIDEHLNTIKDSGNLQPAVVTSIERNHILAYMRDGQSIRIGSEALALVRNHLGEKTNNNKRIRVGSIIRVQERKENTWFITQIPTIQGAFISMDTETGAIRSLVGGFDFNHSSFNRVVQSKRQPGSTFKPFIYSAALEKGITPATIINDAPITFKTATGQIWEPKNSDGRFYGPISVRRALALSRNMPTIRTILAITPEFAQEYIQQFGFLPKDHPPYPTMALGAGATSPLEMAEGYAIFANGGYRVRGYIIDRIEDIQGRILAKIEPKVARQNASLAIDPRNAFIINNMLLDPIRSGTASRVNSLGRNDLHGKTGTTNDGVDAWFAGYNPKLVAITWVGFDTPRSLGRYGFGGIAALPIWMDYMARTLKDKPIVPDTKAPSGVISRHGEYFLEEFQQTNPKLKIDAGMPVPTKSPSTGSSIDSGERILDNSPKEYAQTKQPIVSPLVEVPSTPPSPTIQNSPVTTAPNYSTEGQTN